MSVRLSQLDNGLRVVSHHMPHLETVSLGVWVKAGNRQEAPSEDGVAHFLEHMAFKGTARRSAFDIVEEIEQVGGDLNAATGLDQTAYYATILKPDLKLAVDLLADIVINPVFDDEEIARERQVICQEIMAVSDSPEDVVFDKAQELAFPEQAVGRPVMGRIETVSSITRDDLIGYMKRYYRAPNMVLSAAGHVDHDQLCDYAAKAFDELSTGLVDVIEPACYKGGIGHSAHPFEQGHVVIGLQGIGFTDKRIFAAQVVNATLGGGMSSRLFQEIREKRGLAYHVYSFHSSFEETGLFGVYAATDAARSVEATELMLNEIANCCAEGISLKEINRAKAQLRSGIAMSLESSGARAEQIARQILFFDKLLSNEELIEDVQSVTAEQCQALMNEMVAVGEPTISLAGMNGRSSAFDQFSTYFSGRADIGSGSLQQTSSEAPSEDIAGGA